MVQKTTGSRRDRAMKRGEKTSKPAVKKFNTKINFSHERKKTNAWKVETEVTCIKCKKKFVFLL